MEPDARDANYQCYLDPADNLGPTGLPLVLNSAFKNDSLLTVQLQMKGKKNTVVCNKVAVNNLNFENGTTGG